MLPRTTSALALLTALSLTGCTALAQLGPGPVSLGEDVGICVPVGGTDARGPVIKNRHFISEQFVRVSGGEPVMWRSFSFATQRGLTLVSVRYLDATTTSVGWVAWEDRNRVWDRARSAVGAVAVPGEHFFEFEVSYDGPGDAELSGLTVGYGSVGAERQVTSGMRLMMKAAADGC